MSKTIFITGTSTGFGKLAAITLANAGHTVIAGMRNTTGNNKAVADELAALPNVDVVEIDITSDTSVIQAFEKTLAKYGIIDVLVNNAGVAGFGLLEAYTLDQIRAMFEVNFYGIIRTYQAVLPAMRKAKNGLIINLTSGASGHTLPFMVPYLSSKFAVESLTEGINDELRAYGIENTSIQPGPYPTEMNNGSRVGVLSDKPEITEAYGEPAAEQFAALGTGIFGNMAKFDMNPQHVADGILALVEMEKGTRPLRFPIDAVAQGTDVAFIKARGEHRADWVGKYTTVS